MPQLLPLLVGNRLQKQMDRPLARMATSLIRDEHGGYEKHVVVIDRNYIDLDTNKRLSGLEIDIAQEIEVSHLLSRIYGNSQETNSIWLPEARKLLTTTEELEYAA